MFTAGHIQINKANNQTKNGLLESGMPLAKQTRVKNRFTYREVTLILGIVVALIAVLAVWLKQLPWKADDASSDLQKTQVIIPALQEVIKKVSDNVSLY
jgi:hypothetical protein